MHDYLPNLTQIVITLGAAVLSAFVAVRRERERTKRHAATVDVSVEEVRAKAEVQRLTTEARHREELWERMGERIAALEAKVGALESKIESLQTEKVELIAERGQLRIANEALTQELRDCRAECAELRADRDALRRMLTEERERISGVAESRR
jgi:chromosome segregation ATPase